jgi:hypothetical protein
MLQDAKNTDVSIGVFMHSSVAQPLLYKKTIDAAPTVLYSLASKKYENGH